MSGPEQTLPLLRETVLVRRRSIPTGHVRVRLTTTTRDAPVEVTLRGQDVEIERVAIGRFVDAPPQVRSEGDTTIVPVLEERAVVTTRLFLREELHLHTRSVTRTERRSVPLRSQQAEVERLGPTQGESIDE